MIKIEQDIKQHTNNVGSYTLSHGYNSNGNPYSSNQIRQKYVGSMIKKANFDGNEIFHILCYKIVSFGFTVDLMVDYNEHFNGLYNVTYRL